MAKNKYVLGLDFGTDSVRALIVDIENGEEEATYVSNYKRWSQGKYSDPSKNQLRQHPLDYIESLQESVRCALETSTRANPGNILGIGVGTTTSTTAPIDSEGNVLALRDDFRSNPNAMFIIWKDHTAVEEAEIINKITRLSGGIDYTSYSGGVYSSEWFWSKILHTLKVDKNVRDNAFSWIELSDWVPAILTGNIKLGMIKRNRCVAGHKAMWNEAWGGLPSEEFLCKVSTLLKGLRRRMYADTFTSDQAAGSLTREWAEKLGLNEGITVAVGGGDAHMGAVGSMIKRGTLVKIIGTSCCDMAVFPKKEIGNKLVSGICGQVDGSIIPDMIGFEAGQSAFGDIFAWFRDLLLWPLIEILQETKTINKKTSDNLKNEIYIKILPRLTSASKKIDTNETSLIALDWLNGRRTPYADQRLKGVVAGLSLGTTAPGIFRAFIEAIAYGSKAIVERFIEEGITIKEIVAVGGIPHKNTLVMQILSDVLGMPVKVTKTNQAVALGAAMFAAVASGKYMNIYQAQEKMGSGFAMVYKPDKNNIKLYKKLYNRYKIMGEKLEGLLREHS